MLMKFAPGLRNTVVEFGFASVLRVSANVSSQIFVGRHVWKDLQHAPVSLNKKVCQDVANARRSSRASSS